MATSQKFGGNWTEEKLNIFTSYLDAYLIALQNQKFKKIYIDALLELARLRPATAGSILWAPLSAHWRPRRSLITTIS